MNVAVIDGYLGAGKTLAMSILASYFASRSNCTLYSNFGLKDSKEFSSFDTFLDISMQPSSILCLDEAHSDMDSRNSTTNQAKFWSHLMFYLRKMRCTVFLATPGIENLDSRVRLLCNLYIHVTKTKTHFLYDMYDMQSGRFLRRYKIAQESAFIIANGIYDTYKMVLPVEYPSSKEEFQNLLTELKETSDNYYRQVV